jgi:hypothetical protein
VVTVGMDTMGAEACRPFVEAAAPEHPSLVDVAHVLGERFGVVNVPNGVWIDEQGVIVRPAEPAFPGDRSRAVRRSPTPEGLPERMRDILTEASRIETDPERYAVALRDWVARGAVSPYALGPDQVVTRSASRDGTAARGAAHFELGQHLWRQGRADDAVRHFREAHRLQPDNLTYKRQAWSMASPGTGPFERFWQGPVEGREDEWPYEGDWLSEIRERGPERYYPTLDL